MSHKDIIKKKLEKEGEVTNLWCLQNNIWRLSDVILNLRREGMDIETVYMKDGVDKNCHYRLKVN